ncbi:UNKNOWN [Stylonychia lemnae]|uniref:Uncharacterized protein n=1 Tax=Stylonychia lemnae TaxID=5949 RepID=A0A078ANE1_STYLE|nr:UNKNOWN [Stylonychia lemnae]|eukprot:CDW82857.1 UNKNOWN [Stylonychia lemnae]
MKQSDLSSNLSLDFLDTNCLSSDDYISDDEKDVHSLPHDYKFFVNQMRNSDHMMKDLKRINEITLQSFKTIQENMRNLEKYSLERARFRDDRINRNQITFDNILKRVKTTNKPRNLTGSSFMTDFSWVAEKSQEVQIEESSSSSSSSNEDQILQNEITQINTKLNLVELRDQHPSSFSKEQEMQLSDWENEEIKDQIGEITDYQDNSIRNNKYRKLSWVNSSIAQQKRFNKSDVEIRISSLSQSPSQDDSAQTPIT